MTTGASSQLPVRFGVFELDAITGELRKSGRTVHLRPQAAKVLLLLVSRASQLVTREEIHETIWGNETFVDFEHGLNLCIREVRAALDDDADTPRYVQTLPKRGYRFIAPVNGTQGDVPSPAGTGQPTQLQALKQRSGVKQPLIRRWWPVATFGLVVLAIAVAWLIAGRLRERVAAKNPSGRIESVAVLPLENLSRDPEQEYFADGMTDALITDLAKIHALRVISRNSIMQYKGNRKPMPQIARELNVDAVVEGTVMRSGDQVRITAQLIDAPKDRHLWAETYERDLRDILAMQDEVAKAIAGEVKITLTPQEQSQLSNARQVDPAANEAYLRGLYELHGMTAESTETSKAQSLEKAVGYFQEALTDDPNDALAYSGLADAYSNLSTHYRAPLEVMPKAKAAAVKAVELDDTLAEAHASLGYVSLIFDWDWARAEHEFRRALELNPSSARAHAGYAEYLLFVSHRSDEALQELHRAYALDPLLPLSHGDLAWLLFLARRYPESVEASQRVGHDDHILALSYAELGRPQEALAAADRAVKSTQNPVILSQAAAAYALAGSKDKARAMLPGIEGQARKRYVCGFNVACLYSVLGDKEQAFAWLEKAHRDRSD